MRPGSIAHHHAVSCSLAPMAGCCRQTTPQAPAASPVGGHALERAGAGVGQGRALRQQQQRDAGRKRGPGRRQWRVAAAAGGCTVGIRSDLLAESSAGTHAGGPGDAADSLRHTRTGCGQAESPLHESVLHFRGCQLAFSAQCTWLQRTRELVRVFCGWGGEGSGLRVCRTCRIRLWDFGWMQAILNRRGKSSIAERPARGFVDCRRRALVDHGRFVRLVPGLPSLVRAACSGICLRKHAFTL